MRLRQRRSREMFLEEFPTNVIWGKTKITRALMFQKGWEGKHSETECFFSFLWLFRSVEYQRLLLRSQKC